MMKRYQRWIALGVTMAFLTLLPIASQPLPAAPSLNQDKNTSGSAEQTSTFVEKEQQVSFQSAHRNTLPILLGILAVGAAVFLLVILVSKIKNDVTGVWEFHNDFTTEGFADYDSTWTFTPYDDYDRALGTFSRNANGKVTNGHYTVDKEKDVVFQDNANSEQYIGSFDSKTTMSGRFQITSGAFGKWTAKKK